MLVQLLNTTADATHDEASIGLAQVAAIAAELGELKRVRAGHLTSSFAAHLFNRAWSALAGRSPAAVVAADIVDRALIACRLGAIDAESLAAFGLTRHEVDAVLDAARATMGVQPPGTARLTFAPAPAFTAQLCRQPRAGATAPNMPRTILEPAESHGDHCLVVAVIGVLIARLTGADEGRVFLAGLAHHLHNAQLPDSGYAGEMLLGPLLEPLMARLVAAEIATLAPDFARQVDDVLLLVGDAVTADGRAFNAADAIDRVQQVHYHARAAAFTARAALVDLDLVHAGPLQAFQKGLLRDLDLMP